MMKDSVGEEDGAPAKRQKLESPESSNQEEVVLESSPDSQHDNEGNLICRMNIVEKSMGSSAGFLIVWFVFRVYFWIKLGLV